MGHRERTKILYQQDNNHGLQKEKKREEEVMEIMLGNQTISYKESTKFLGMTLDSRLNWEEHIDKTRAKAKRALNIIKIVAGKKWGADRKTLKKLYSAICRSKMDYGYQLYDTATKSRLKKLDSIHREGIRIYTSAFRIYQKNHCMHKHVILPWS